MQRADSCAVGGRHQGLVAAPCHLPGVTETGANRALPQPLCWRGGRCIAGVCRGTTSRCQCEVLLQPSSAQEMPRKQEKVGASPPCTPQHRGRADEMQMASAELMEGNRSPRGAIRRRDSVNSG